MKKVLCGLVIALMMTNSGYAEPTNEHLLIDRLKSTCNKTGL